MSDQAAVAPLTQAGSSSPEQQAAPRIPKLLVTRRDGVEISIAGETGSSVMAVIREGGADELLALCGGCLVCATCHVYVGASFAARLPAMSPDEDALLDGSSHRRPESRLACQLPFLAELDGMMVTIAPED